MDGIGIFGCSLAAILVTSAVPIAIFLLLGPILFQSNEICQKPGSNFMLNVLVALGIGSLLGDVFFHLIPEIFNVPSSSLKYGGVMLGGIFFFLVGERLLTHYHQGHGHHHLGEADSPDCNDNSTGEIGAGLQIVPTQDPDPLPSTQSNAAVLTAGRKPVGLLILASDFIHNFVDGIAIGASFATSPSVGISTSMAVFLHEIPHELSDFAILLKCGFAVRTVVLCNLVTTMSSVLGVVASLVILNVSGLGKDGTNIDGNGSHLNPLEPTIKLIILSLTVGNFLYIALADLVPELLHGEMGIKLYGEREQNSNIARIPYSCQSRRILLSTVQYLAFLVGAIIMLLIKIYGD